MYLRILLLAVLATSAMATTFDACQNGAPPLALRVVGCEVPPCVIQVGSNIDAQADFRVPKPLSRLTAKARARVGPLNVNYTLPEPNACNTLVDSTCPLEEGDIATYWLNFKLPLDIPVDNVHVELRVINGDVPTGEPEDVIFCFGVQVQTVL